MKIIQVENPKEKAQIVAEVLYDLPQWFGLPESTKAYIEESRDLPLWAAMDKDEIIGFITIQETSKSTIEIHCMGVKETYHRQGVGKLLLQEVLNYAKDKYRLIQVKTVAQGHYDTYDKTNAFYHSVGFLDLEIFPTLWDEWNPCQVMVMSL